MFFHPLGTRYDESFHACGYLLPCGCSRPQFGGLERRFNLLAVLRQQGWPVAAFDLGDIPQREGPRKLANIQGKLKYEAAPVVALDNGK